MIAGIRPIESEVVNLSVKDAILLTLGLSNSPLTIYDTKRYLDFFVKKNKQVVSFVVSPNNFERLISKLIRLNYIDQSINAQNIYTIFLTENGEAEYKKIYLRYIYTSIGEFIDSMKRYFGYVA